MFFKKYTFDDIPSVNLNDLKKKIKMVVIDDDPNSFPLSEVQDFGFTIEYWDKIDTGKLKRLENKDFDVIILDIQGVVDPSLGKLNGLDILKTIKSKNKEQVIVAFSGSRYDVSKGEFWKMADAFLKKPIDVFSIKEELEELLETHFTNNKLIKNLKEIFNESTKSQSDYEKLENIITKSIIKSSSLDPVAIAKLGIVDVKSVIEVASALKDLYEKFADE